MNTSKHKISSDELLGIGLLWFFKATLLAVCLFIFVITLLVLPAIFFPNGTGWHDLSNTEILFLSGLIILTTRYVLKVRKHSANINRAIYRYLIAFGLHAITFLSTPIFIYVSGLGDDQLLSDDTYYFLLISYKFSLLIILFAIVPKGELRNISSNAKTSFIKEGNHQDV